jgi:hypothetical protein
MSHPFLKLSFFVLLSFFISCDKPTVPNPGPEINKNFVFPLAVGNQWEYDIKHSFIEVEPGSGNDPAVHDTTYFSNLNMEVVRTEIIQDSINTFVIRQILNNNDNIKTSESYYNELDSGMYYYAHWGGGTVMPKSIQNYRLVFNGMTFNNIDELKFYLTNPAPHSKNPIDSLIHEIPPLQYLKYPLETGSEWTFREPEEPFQIDKKIVAFENVTVPAGSFYCYKIQWMYPDNNFENAIYHDYISEKGLVKTSFIIEDILLITSDGDTLGVYDIKDESVLVSTNLD